MKKPPLKNFKYRRLAIGSLSAATVASLIGVGAYFLVDYARSIAKTTFVAAYDLSLNDVFRDNPEVVVNSEWISGEEGFVVNKGPIRVKSAYRTLFDKESLIEMAEWLYNDVNWGANGLSLTEMNFTTGIDSRSSGVTLGAHTSGREGSNIFMSPDAFETSRAVTSRFITMLGERLTPTLSSIVVDYNKAFQVEILANPVANEVPPNVNRFLTDNFNDEELGQGYTELTSAQVGDVLARLFGLLNADNFFTGLGVNDQSEKNASPNKAKWAELLDNTYLGDGVYSNLVRKFQALNSGRHDEFFKKILTSRMGLIMAWRLTLAATNNSSVANVFLKEYLPDYVSYVSDKAMDDKTAIRSISPVSDWDSNFEVLSSSLPEESAETVKNVLKLFKAYYQVTQAFLNRETTKPLLKTISDYGVHPFVLLSNARTMLVSYSAADRMRLMLDGYFLTPIRTPALREDELIHTPKEWQTILANLTRDRQIRVTTNKVISDYVNMPQTYLVDANKNPTSPSKYFKRMLINTMRYTIAHEYGHHETLWQAAGEYDETYQLFSVEAAASSVTPFDKKPLARLFSLGKVSPGFKSISDNLRIANDQYSGTLSPAHFSYNYYRYLQGVGQEQPTWEADQLLQYFYYPGARASINQPGGEHGTRSKVWTGTGQDTYEGSILGLEGGGPYVFRLKDDLFERASRLLPSFSRNMQLNWSIDNLLYEYQVSKWLKDFDDADKLSGAVPGAAKAAFEKANKVELPIISDPYAKQVFLNSAPTVALASYESGVDALSLVLILWYSVLSDGSKLDGTGLTNGGLVQEGFRAAVEIIKDINSFIEPMYERLLAKYPNLFSATDTLPKIDDYTRSLIVTNDVYENTKAAVDKLPKGEVSLDDLPAGIYMDPNFKTYQLYHNLLNSEQNFMDYQEGKFNAVGIAQGGSIQEAFSDYTGDYAEFLTRSWNQFYFRPDLNNFLKPDGKIDAANLFADNDGWYEDTARLRAHGINYYNFNPHDASDTFITDDGARQLMWFRELLGLHSNLDWVNNLPHDSNGKVDLDALDASLDWASSLEKVYRNYRSGKFSMWGWLTPAEATRYKYIVIRSNTGGDQYIPIKTKNTSNYFYYTDLTNANRRSMTPNFVQWAAEWFIAGHERNANLIAGEENEVYFAEELGGPVVSIARTQNGNSKIVRNNEFRTIMAQALATVDPKNNTIKVQMRANEV